MNDRNHLCSHGLGRSLLKYDLTDFLYLQDNPGSYVHPVVVFIKSSHFILRITGGMIDISIALLSVTNKFDTESSCSVKLTSSILRTIISRILRTMSVVLLFINSASVS
ncbi:GfV-D4-ORF2 [Ichnoviriform fumiferanae]|uniref:GfV-D1-ORF2 n=1 Tax=Ichnoviriform fumiferanae TaxID=419435 RepID=A2PZZ2_9VIRU|nr:GfV-D1-ORF2 [Ichnoviriform fumiferanae]YP_001029445.1 GfV-D4-ORF2 [Ichnoviriform fumiferanae]BAF45564.1 GfV-D1-ORF2 [Ichnoviriform fumiferanae]BAF45570.1 GfV-D4-ORF2 [Ichnoviriform fumiferanae]